MSDDERGPRGGGYRLEVAKRSQAKCKDEIEGNKIEKGSLRLGTMVMIQDRNSFAWRHWGCVTPKIIENLKKKHDIASDIDGFEELSEEFQSKVEKAYEDGHVADVDIPDTARKPEGENDERKGKKTTKKRARGDVDDEDASAKEHKKAAPRKRGKKEDDEVAARPARKGKAKASESGEVEQPRKGRKKAKVEEDLSMDEEMPQNSRNVSRKKAVTTKTLKKSKPIDDESGEDFGDELGKVGDDEEEQSEAEVKAKKRAKPTSKTSKPMSKTSKKPSSRTKKAEKVASDEDD